MSKNLPILFKHYKELHGKVPWTSILTNIPTPIDRLRSLENHFDNFQGEIYIKRDDICHNLYGGNKLRKFEFIFAYIKKKRKAVMTFGGIGTNHGMACAIVSKMFNLKCHLFLIQQPLTWHVQRYLLLFDYFGAKLRYAKGYGSIGLKALFFKIFHPKTFLILPGGSIIFGKGNPLGVVGFINAAFELKEQIDKGIIPKPDALFVAGGTGGTSAGLIAGIKLLNLKIKVYIVCVTDERAINPKAIQNNANKALLYLQNIDDAVPKIQVKEDDFKIIYGYIGSGYGVKTKKSQDAVDLVMELEGKNNGFKLDTTYTGKTMAAMFDFIQNIENSRKKVLFWNTYNSNDLVKYLKEIEFDYKRLPKKFHRFYKNLSFQCWQIKNCPDNIKLKCNAYLNDEYRCWLIKKCTKENKVKCESFKKLNQAIEYE